MCTCYMTHAGCKLTVFSEFQKGQKRKKFAYSKTASSGEGSPETPPKVFLFVELELKGRLSSLCISML